MTSLPSMTAFKASIGIGRGIGEKLEGGDVKRGLDGKVNVDGMARSINAGSYWHLGGVGVSRGDVAELKRVGILWRELRASSLDS